MVIQKVFIAEPENVSIAKYYQWTMESTNKELLGNKKSIKKVRVILVTRTPWLLIMKPFPLK